MNSSIEVADYAFSGGTGDAQTPYLLNSAADVAQLAANVRGQVKYTGKYFKLTCDLDICGENLPPQTSSNKDIGG